MSIVLNINDIEYSLKEKICKELKFTPQSSKKYQNNYYSTTSSSQIIPYHIDDKDMVFLPFRYCLETVPNTQRPERKTYTSIDNKFTQELRQGQKDVKSEIIKLINKTGSCILSFYPGFGKTSLSIYLSTRIGLKTAIVVHRIILMEQWVESIKKFCPTATYSIIRPKHKKSDLEVDFLILNAINVPKIGYDAFRDVGLLVVDEIHTMATETLSKCLYYFTPRYLVGLSATPTRPDGMDALLDVYFGKEKITKQLFRRHMVYQIDTNLEPQIKLNQNGMVDWSSVIEFQSNSVERNALILKIVGLHGDRKFLILCKRISQVQYLRDRLIETGENVSTLIDGETKYDPECRILIATFQKCGVGFSKDDLNALILAADVEEYFIQYLGRVMRTEEGEPLIFDLLDNNKTLKRHWGVRKKVYLECGGKIQKMKI
jgi:superfamily II DNA or RNA helicase